LQKHEVMNVACGDQISLNGLIGSLNIITGMNLRANYLPERKGDVRHSRADISKISNVLNYKPQFDFNKGLNIVYEWYRRNSKTL
jgi:UDP-N-acetylglucosamine 4-epimerase